MNPKVPQKIIEHLKSIGYDVRTELGDNVITQGDGQHLIYIQVRDGKKTYIPITLTVSAPEPGPILVPELIPEPEAVPVSPLLVMDEISYPEILSTEPIKNIPEPSLTTAIEPEPVTVPTPQPVWDENITELLAKIQSTKETLRTLIQS